MDANFSDIPGIRQSQVCPGLASISRLVHAIAVRDIATDGRLAHTGIDHVGIRSRNGNCTNRCAFKEAVGHIFPDDAAIGCFPHTSAGRAKIEYLRMHRIAGHCYDSPSTKWADQAPLKRVQHSRIDHRSSLLVGDSGSPGIH